MTRYHRKVDANQAVLVTELRRVGASVQSLASLGQGTPDLLVGWRGGNYLFEVKDPRKPPAQRKLTEAEERWHGAWRGRCYTVETFDECCGLLGIEDEVLGI